MNITRVFTGQQFQKFQVFGAWNNKLVGIWDTNSTNIDDGRPATLDLAQGPSQTPVAVNFSPFVRSANCACQPWNGHMTFNAMKPVKDWLYPAAKAGVVLDITTNPRVIALEDPLGPASTRQLAANHINENGIYGRSLDKTIGRCRWDFDGKLVEKNLDYVCIMPNGEKLDLNWCNSNVTLPDGYYMGGGDYLANSGWVVGQFYTNGSNGTIYHGFIVDPTGTVPDAKLFLPCDDWSRSRVLDVSPDGRFVALRTLSIDPNYLKPTDYTWIVDTATDKHYDLKKLLGLDPWLAYQVVDVDFLNDGTNRFVTSSVSFEGIGTTSLKQVHPIDLWDGLE